MIRYYLSLIVILTTGLLVGDLIVPTDETLALIHLKARNYDAARPLFERLASIGSHQVRDLLPLLELRLQMGDMEGAIRLLEQFVRTRPDHLEARQLLGKYYHLAQRPVDELNNLEEIRRLNPTQEVLTALVDRYELMTFYDRERDVLKQLIREHGQNPAYFIRLAELLAADGRWAETADVLRQLRSRHPKEMNHDLVLLLADVLILDRQFETALEESREWLEWNFDPETAAALGDLLHHKVSGVCGWRLLADWRDKAGEFASLLAKWTELAMVMGHSTMAMKYLERLLQQKKLSIRVAGQLIEIALKNEREDLARQALVMLGREQFPDWLQSVYLDYALEHENSEIARFLTPYLNESLLASNPLQAARWAWIQKNRAQALEWIRLAREDVAAPMEQKTGILHLMMMMGEKDAAMAWSRTLAAQPDTPEWLVWDLARFYIDGNHAQTGWKLFSGLRRQRADKVMDKGWVLLAVLAGQETQEVRGWLQKNGHSVEAAYLRDVVQAALDRKNGSMAMTGARILLEREANDESRRLLAEAMLVEGQWDAAQALIAGWERHPQSELRAFYAQVHQRLWETEKKASDALRRVVRVSLEQPGYYGLTSQPEPLAHLALALGDKETAEQGFLFAARGKGAESPQVNQLLYLWGPRPAEHGRRWLLERTGQSAPGQMAGWLRQLLRSGMTEDVARLGRQRLAKGADDPEVSDLVLQGLLARDDQAAAREWILTRSTGADAVPERLLKLVKIAEEYDLRPVVGTLWQAILERRPDDETALLKLGELAFQNRQWRVAADFFQRRLEKMGVEFQTCHLLGESLYNLGDEARGRFHLQEAVRLIEASDSATLEDRLTLVRLHHRLGHWERALVGYADLLTEFPDNAPLRAQYGELLLERGERDRARWVLSGGMES